MEYFKSPRTVGAVAPSSKKLAEKMAHDIDFDHAKMYCGVWSWNRSVY